MNKIATLLLMLVTGAANAAATVDVVTPDALYPEGYVTLDTPGTIRFDSGANFDSSYIVSGTGDIYYELGTKQIPSYPFRVTTMVPKGFTCADACSIYFVEKLPSWTCPGDGQTLQASHLKFSLDGEVIYDEPQRFSDQICYLTPATQATASWVAPLITFDNSLQIQRSLTTTVRVSDPAYNFSQHTFTADPGVTCSSNLVRVYLGSRFKYYLKESGFVCQSQVPAYTVLYVTVE